MNYYVTREVAQKLGVGLANFQQMIHRGLIPGPPKDAGGRYVWLNKHILAARKALTELQAERAAAKK